MSNPAEAYPSLFGGSAFLIKFPYILPCAVVAAISIGSSILGLFLFDESLKKRDPTSSTDVIDKLPARKVLLNPFVISCISLYGIVAFSTILFDEVTIFSLFFLFLLHFPNLLLPKGVCHLGG